MFPSAPPFTGALRLARLSDVPRIGVVAASAFYHSSWFQYERPYYQKYPLDTLSSYRSSFRTAILDPNSIVLVIEATLDRNESSKVYDALADSYPAFEDQIPDDMLQKNRAVVSVAAYSLVTDSPRRGQFQPDDEHDHFPPDPPQHRDKDKTAADNMEKYLHPQEAEVFEGCLVIDMMVTHPAYWSKGHATTVTNWILDLARLDRSVLGVAGAPMGKVFFSGIGFEEVKTVEIPGYKAHPKPIYAWLARKNESMSTGGESSPTELTPITSQSEGSIPDSPELK
ncbi:hypothetical protein B0T19DRAFT_413124 [Cercophora scortea]|uniref:Uncharacterized protein n=1 Tax=Cercophora scortea TaxID=314031 RepID=A0AAE0J6S8_9PEZI|nr:hypothetical protein B0T19DRAFT_413124 [Cercophora scortea]